VSKLFDEAKKAQWSQPPANLRDAQDLDVGEILEKIEYPETVAPRIAESDVAEVEIPEEVAAPAAPVAEVRTALLAKHESPIAIPGETSSPAVIESYRALRTRLLNKQVAKAFKSVMITSALPAEGKTLTALNLALCCSQLPETRVLVVDADLRSRGLSHLFGNPETSGLAEVLSGEITPEEAVQKTEHKNLFVVTAGAYASKLSSAEQFGGQHWCEFIAKSSENFSLVLVDSPPVLAVADSEMIGNGCEAVMVVVRALRTNREVLQRLAGSIDKSKLLGVVYNGMPEGIMSRHHGYGYGYGYGLGNGGGNGKK
jgi:protein-tyrosine kinase